MINVVYVLALDKRKEFIPALEKQVNDLLGLPLEKFWVGDGEDKNIKYDLIDLPKELGMHMYVTSGDHSVKGHFNAFRSHRAILNKALKNGYNKILLLEDDVIFLEERWKKIWAQNQIQDFVNSDKYDGLMLGWQCREHEKDSDDLDRIERAWKNSGSYGIYRAFPNSYGNFSGLHGIILTRKLIEFILNNCEKGPIDAFLNQRFDFLNIYYFAPKLINCLAGWSFTEGKFQHRSNLI